MRGRKPTPKSIRELDGNASHRPLLNCPEPPSFLPDPPAHLSIDARRFWRRMGPKFSALGIMAEVDEAAFAMFCQGYADWCRLIRLHRKDGALIKVNGQLVPSPYEKLSARAGERVRKLLSEFGGSPASRTRISVKPTDGPDELTAFLESPIRLAE